MNAHPRRLKSYWSSSIGKKFIVALTGIVLVTFLAGHLAGNMLVFVGREAFNDYAAFLHSSLHGTGVWIARIALLTALVLHIVATVSLTRTNRAARVAYCHPDTIQASKSSRIMIWTGLTILLFVIYHLLHFTIRVGNEYSSYVDPIYLAATGEERHDAWKMVIDGFSVWYVSAFYVLAISVLCSHLGHGVASIFQTLGVNSRKTRGPVELFSWGYSGIIWLGFISIPVAIFIFKFGR